MTETEGGLDKVAEVLTWRDSKLFSESERVAQVLGDLGLAPSGTA